MSNTIIQVENLGKKYLIKHQQQGSYNALRDVITDKVKSFGKKLISPWNNKQSSIYSRTEEFWALKDVSFKVKQGEVIGIIGRNGAGKSTLLKIISRITEPTEGRIRINGRVASLLEVGTGFHPELTGRENIFLNGAIQGMGKTEIKRKFDEIVAFAEIERFLDTPVKRYSSGMYIRLAFAVAAHLEPEILVVDEVLAVGDATFQKKCLGKMGETAKGGRTVLFVSHNMAAIKSMCQNTILLDSGKKIAEGRSEEMILRYLDTGKVDAAIKVIPEEAHVTGTSKVRVLRAKLIGNQDLNGFIVYWKQPINIELDIEVRKTIRDSVFGVGIVSMEGIPILTVHHNDTGAPMWGIEPGIYRINVSLENPLRAGFYKLVIGAHEGIAKTSIFYIPDALQLQILDVSQNNKEYIHHNSGLINGDSTWKIQNAIKQ